MNMHAMNERYGIPACKRFLACEDGSKFRLLNELYLIRFGCVLFFRSFRNEFIRTWSFNICEFMVSIWQTDIACIHIILRRGWVNRFEALTGDIMTCVTKYCFDSDQMVYASLFEKCYDGFDKGKWIKWINWETVWLTNPTVMMSYNLHGIWCGCVCVRCVLKLPLAWTQNANSNTNICI